MPVADLYREALIQLWVSMPLAKWLRVVFDDESYLWDLDEMGDEDLLLEVGRRRRARTLALKTFKSSENSTGRISHQKRSQAHATRFDTGQAPRAQAQSAPRLEGGTRGTVKLPPRDRMGRRSPLRRTETLDPTRFDLSRRSANILESGEF